MADEYIKREDAINTVAKWLWDIYGIKEQDGTTTVFKKLRSIRAEDVVSVVRCKDCKNWNRNHISCEGLALCNTGEGGFRYRSRIDFCSKGSKMNGEI